MNLQFLRNILGNSSQTSTHLDLWFTGNLCAPAQNLRKATLCEFYCNAHWFLPGGEGKDNTMASIWAVLGRVGTEKDRTGQSDILSLRNAKCCSCEMGLGCQLNCQLPISLKPGSLRFPCTMLEMAATSVPHLLRLLSRPSVREAGSIREKSTLEGQLWWYSHSCVLWKCEKDPSLSWGSSSPSLP